MITDVKQKTISVISHSDTLYVVKVNIYFEDLLSYEFSFSFFHSPYISGITQYFLCTTYFTQDRVL